MMNKEHLYFDKIQYRSEKTIYKIIDEFPYLINPEYVDIRKNNILLWACEKSMTDVATLLITTFGEKCNPQQVNFYNMSALIFSQKNNMSMGSNLLVEKTISKGY
jgi:acetylglutamate synthase